MVSDRIRLYFLLKLYLKKIDKQTDICFSSVGDFTVNSSFFWTVCLSSCSSDPSPSRCVYKVMLCHKMVPHFYT